VSRFFLLALALTTPWAARAQAARDATMLNLSCVEALVSIDQANLAGVFSFVPEKDGPAAFADLVVHQKKALKKFLGKLERDQKEAGGVSAWDHEAAAFALSIYRSPLGETIDKPGEALLKRLEDAARAPTMTLQEMTARRRKG
jgi:hypothetical protein